MVEYLNKKLLAPFPPHVQHSSLRAMLICTDLPQQNILAYTHAVPLGQALLIWATWAGWLTEFSVNIGILWFQCGCAWASSSTWEIEDDNACERALITGGRGISILQPDLGNYGQRPDNEKNSKESVQGDCRLTLNFNTAQNLGTLPLFARWDVDRLQWQGDQQRFSRFCFF